MFAYLFTYSLTCLVIYLPTYLYMRICSHLCISIYVLRMYFLSILIYVLMYLLCIYMYLVTYVCVIHLFTYISIRSHICIYIYMCCLQTSWRLLRSCLCVAGTPKTQTHSKHQTFSSNPYSRDTNSGTSTVFTIKATVSWHTYCIGCLKQTVSQLS